MGYWLFKSDPESFSYADLERSRGRTTGWDGVRNYQARNYLRDGVKVGDQVFFYESGEGSRGIVGIAEVVKGAHADPTAFDPSDSHFDPKSDRSSPTWVQVSIRAVRRIEPPLGLGFLKAQPELAGLELLRRGSRLSVMPVSDEHGARLLALGERPAGASAKGAKGRGR
jgi:predicted RNA-binding protein with PUA-like domain